MVVKVVVVSIVSYFVVDDVVLNVLKVFCKCIFFGFGLDGVWILLKFVNC